MLFPMHEQPIVKMERSFNAICQLKYGINALLLILYLLAGTVHSLSPVNLSR